MSCSNDSSGTFRVKSSRSDSESDISSIYRSRICSLDSNKDSTTNVSEEYTDSILYTNSTILQSVLNEVITTHNFIDNRDINIDIQYMSAIKHNDIEYLSKLLTAFPNLVKSVEITAKSGLHIAVIENHYDVVELLLQHNVQINVFDDMGKTGLHFCNDPLIMDLLCRFNPCIDFQDSYGFTPLHIAIINNNIECVKVLLKYSANPMIVISGLKCKNGLHLAVENCHYDILYLIFLKSNHNILIDSIDDDGNTSLHLILLSENLIGNQQKIFILLLDKGSNVSMINRFGATPLHYICGNRYLCTNLIAEPLVQLLLDFRANPNTCDFEGCTPLTIACAHREWSICKLLIIAGGDMNLPCNMNCKLLKKGDESCSNMRDEIELGDCTCSDLMPRSQRSKLFRFICVKQTFINEYSRDRCMQCACSFNTTDSFNNNIGTNNRRYSIFSVLKILSSGKHHCRHCGRLVCRNCSPNSLPLAKMPKFLQDVSIEKTLRVCVICFDELK